MQEEDVALTLFVAAPVAAGCGLWAFRRRVRGTRATKPQLVAGNAFALVFLLTVAALAGECWFRFAYDGTDSFGMLRSTKRWFERHYRKNAAGVRDDMDADFSPATDGRRRVAFVGDSFTVGHGVADVDARFANRVRAARPKWDVQLFAENGLDTAAETKLLSDRIPAFAKREKPYDVVVLVYCLNDLGDLIPGSGAFARRLAGYRERGVLARSSSLFDTLRFLSIAATEPEVRSYFPSVASAYADDTIWIAQRGRLRDLQTAVEKGGGRLAVVTFPFVHRLDAAHPFREAHRRLDEHWRAQGVPHFDLLPAFEGRDARDLVCGAFDAHPNARAHAIAAEAMLPFLDGVVTTSR